MSKIIKINSFDGVSLDTATYKQRRVYDDGGRIFNSLYVAIDGTKFDAAASNDNTVVAGNTELEIIAKGATSALFVTNTDAIIALGATVGTLIAEDANGNTISCTARCAPIERALELSTFYNRTAYFTLRWERKTEWA